MFLYLFFLQFLNFLVPFYSSESLYKYESCRPILSFCNIKYYNLPLFVYLLIVGVCSRWRDAACNTSFHLRVLSVESGAKDQVNSGTLVLGPHTYTCISDALESALPGDTISLCVGHHWESTLKPRIPVRLISG